MLGFYFSYRSGMGKSNSGDEATEKTPIIAPEQNKSVQVKTVSTESQLLPLQI